MIISNACRVLRHGRYTLERRRIRNERKERNLECLVKEFAMYL
jgi:translation initiation factor IF-3